MSFSSDAHRSCTGQIESRGHSPLRSVHLFSETGPSTARTTSSTEIANEINILMRDGKMSPDSRILMVGEGKFDLFQCATIADISYEGLTWLLVLVAQHGDFRRIRVNLQTQGITHILVNRSYLMWIATHVHMDAEQLTNLEYLRFSVFHLERFLQAHARLVGSHEGCALYEVE